MSVGVHIPSHSKMSSLRVQDSTIKLQLTADSGTEHLFYVDFRMWGYWMKWKKVNRFSKERKQRTEADNEIKQRQQATTQAADFHKICPSLFVGYSRLHRHSINLSAEARQHVDIFFLWNAGIQFVCFQTKKNELEFTHKNCALHS